MTCFLLWLNMWRDVRRAARPATTKYSTLQTKGKN
jgi:hypothetical protein